LKLLNLITTRNKASASLRGLLFHALFALVCSFRCIATDVLTYHNDNARTGCNPNEVVLTPANVNPNAFGLIFNLIVDGKVDAQPLYVSNAPVLNRGIFRGNHNLIIVATEHDSLYAFDADTGVLYWQSVLLGSGETTSEPRFGCGQVTPEIGITATPVIDRNKGTHGTIYVVAMSKAGGVYHQRLWGIDLATGQDVAGSPVEIHASYPGNGPTNDGNGHVLFDPGAYKDRCGLLLLNGIIYTAWASHCDIAPYTSWIIAYDETSMQQVRVLNLDPNGGAPSSALPDGSGNAFWSSGAGPAADANGFIYALTANGPFETTLTANGFPDMGDYGDTFLKLSTARSLSASDYFTPFDQAKAAANDTDLGSGGAVVLPDMVDHNGAIRHLTIGAGKNMNIYLVDRDNMGKFNPARNSNIYQELAGALPGGEFATAAYFNGAVYYGPVGGALRKFTFTQALLDRIPAAMTSTVFSYPGVTPSVSSSGTNAAIVWAYENPNGGGPAVLHAYNASDLIELYNSNQRPGRDQFGVANKFITPTICNGKVLVGTTNSVGVFGLLNSPPTKSNESIFTTQVPASLHNTDGIRVDYELGVRFQSSASGQIKAIRFWKDSSENGIHTAHIWSGTGKLLASVTFTDETASGWQQQSLTVPLPIAANAEYLTSVNTGNTYYVATDNGLASQIVSSHLSSIIGGNGRFGPPGKYPTQTYHA
jgi:hypothetical protein